MLFVVSACCALCLVYWCLLCGVFDVLRLAMFGVLLVVYGVCVVWLLFVACCLIVVDFVLTAY